VDNNGERFPLGRWIREEEEKLTFYSENDFDRYNLVSEYFYQKVLYSSPFDNPQYVTVSSSSSSSEDPKHMKNNQNKDNNSNNNASTDDLTLTTASSGVSTVTPDISKSLTSSSTTELPAQSSARNAEKESPNMSINMNNNNNIVEKLICFEYQTKLLYHIGIGKIIESCGDNKKSMLVQRYLVSNPSKPTEGTFVKGQDIIEVAPLKVFARNVALVKGK
jgi:hypothetical protein